MKLALTFTAGLAVVIASGLAYGAWTQRWRKSASLEARAAKLHELPEEFGPWRGQAADLDPDALAMAGAEGWWVRRFTDERSGATLLAIILCGRPGPLSVHKPESCYGAAGYELQGPASKYTPSGVKSAEVWTGKFKESQTGGRELRIFWSWYGDAGWRAADNPRWDFARLPALYKLYVVRETGGRAGRLDDDPAADFLRRLLPEATRVLSEP
ncbi:MAG TPA: exosortase-associated EpsI family protein [Gemmataceae bacterium]|nr:exosortase-associated EpsI family protein [Gemmataceae bacterium]